MFRFNRGRLNQRSGTCEVPSREGIEGWVKKMKKFELKKSLSKKALIGVAIILLPIIISFMLSYSKNKAYIKKRTLGDLTVVAEAYEGQVYKFLEMTKRRAQDFASDGFIRNQLLKKVRGRGFSGGALNKHLVKNKLALDSAIKTIHVLSLDGRVVASTHSAEIGKDYSHEASFINGKDIITIVERKTGHGEEPELAVSAPIVTKETGRPLGIIINFIRISELNNLLFGEFNRKMGAISWNNGRWKTMEIYLVNKDKLMITKSIFIEDAVLRQMVDTPPVNLCLTSGKEMAAFYKNYRGVKVAGASMYFPSMQWTLLAEVDEDEVLAPVNYIKMNGVILGSIVIAMIVLLFILFEEKVVKPLYIISNAAKRIASGHYDVSMPVHTQDEIGMLYESFNRMSNDIKDRTSDLIKSRASLAEAQQIAHIGNWEWDVVNNTTYESEETCHILGMLPEEFDATHKTFVHCIHPDDRDRVVKSVSDALHGKTSYDIEFRVLHKDGASRFVYERAVATLDETGKVIRMTGIIQDITERKLAEESLQKSEELYQSILNNTTSVVTVKDMQGRYTFVNKQYEKLFLAGNMRGKTDYDLWPEGIANVIRTYDRKVMESKSLLEFDEVLPHYDGLHAYISVKFPLCDSKGNVYAVCSILTDITERKRMETELQKAHAQNEQLIASIPSILIYVDKEDRILEWNKTAERVFGIASSTVVGKPFCESGIQWNDREVVKQILSCRNSKQPTRIDDARFRKPDGKVGFLGITVNSVNDTVENQSTLLIIGSDITQRKTIESQLVQAQKLESIGQLAAGIAHEINTPTQYVGDNTRFLQDAFGEFNKLNGKYTELLEACRNGGASVNLLQEIDLAEKEADVEYLIEEIPKAIQQSLEGTERIAKIVRAMKEFSHPGQDEKTPMDINKAIESTITVARNEWKYVADMVTVFDTSLPLVPCLPGEFNQVILNIIINAAHAVSDVVGNGTGRKGIITVTTSRSGNCAEVRIHDTGTGIHEEIKSKIFDPFFTTKPVGKGTGQGLSIVHAIVVEKHRGTITFETEAGKGTTFIIRIPIESDH